MAESLKEKVDRLRQEAQGDVSMSAYRALPIPDTPTKLDTFYDVTKKFCASVAIIAGTAILVAFACWAIPSLVAAL